MAKTKFEISEDKHLSLILFDEEGDEIVCDFNYDECVQINSDNFTYLTLSKENLNELLIAINDAEKYYDNLSDEDWEKMS